MTQADAVPVIEGYLAKLRLALDSAGAADVDDLVAEVRSMLVDAAGDDAERAASEIERLGGPEALATGILAERGVGTSSGMSTAEWWRMGIAVPIDIVIGVSVPLAVLVPLYRAFVSAQGPWLGGARFYGIAAGIALFAGSLVWPWWVWRPWREGGLRTTAGMAITGISVVRAPGFRQVVRTRDLADLGLRSASRSPVVGWVTFLGALALLAFATLGALPAGTAAPRAVPDGALVIRRPDPRFDIAGVKSVAATVYGDAVGGRGEAGSRLVLDGALPDYERLVARAQTGDIQAFSVGGASETAPGVWEVTVTEKSGAGEATVRLTVGTRVTLLARDSQTADLVVTAIEGP